MLKHRARRETSPIPVATVLVRVVRATPADGSLFSAVCGRLGRLIQDGA
jgi:hypothetical protein